MGPAAIDDLTARITGDAPVVRVQKDAGRKPTVEIIEGDCREVLKEFADNSVDAVVTDPPYGLEFMGKEWDKFADKPRREPTTGSREAPFAHHAVKLDRARGRAFQAWCEEWAIEVLRVLKPGGHILAFGGSRTYHRMASAIEDAGFEIRDQIMWIYGSGFPKSSNQKDDWEGWGTALKPAHEPIVVARKPLIGTVPANLIAYGVGALNIDGCRVGFSGDADKAAAFPGGRTTSHGTGSLAGPGDAQDVNRGEFAAERNDLGRWPANVIHDGSDEVLAAFPASSVTGKRSDRSKAATVEGTNWLADNHESTEYTDSGSAARFFYCAKTSKADRDDGLTTQETPVVTFATANGTSGKPSSISEGRNTAYKNTHPTVKPTDLMRYLTRLVTPPGGTVLDPFMGSGSTGRGAVLEGFNFIGIEMDAGYYDIADARIAAAEKEAEKSRC